MTQIMLEDSPLPAEVLEGDAQRPRLLAPRPEDIPGELRAGDRWVVWEAVWRHDPTEPTGGKWSKMPYSPTTGAHASPSDPATWSGFDNAVAALQAAQGRFAGIGFVLTHGDHLAVVELDDGLSADTGRPTREAAALLKRLNTYAERTPSGRGLRLFMEGYLPPGGRRRDNCGLYEAERFVCVTGWRVHGAPKRVELRQGELEELHAEFFPPPPPRPARASLATPPATDKELLEIAFRSASGRRISALFNGDYSGSGMDRNGADLALCSLLGFYTGNDPARLDRLFRASRLFRRKWDERHFTDGRTYGQAVVAKALEGCLLFYNAPMSNPTTYRSLLQQGEQSAPVTNGAAPTAEGPVVSSGESGATTTTTAAAPPVIGVPILSGVYHADVNPVVVAEAQGRAQGLAMSEKVLTAREAAQMLRVSVRMVRRCVKPWRRFGNSPSGDRWLLSDLLGRMGEETTVD